jgi:hypothetical protein
MKVTNILENNDIAQELTEVNTVQVISSTGKEIEIIEENGNLVIRSQKSKLLVEPRSSNSIMIREG